MKLSKLFSMVIIIGLLANFSVINVQAQENQADKLNNALVEFETDTINAKALEIEEPDVLPGDFKYNWQIFKENIGLFFTFDKEKKIKKLEKISSRRLIEAKKLTEIGTTNAATRVKQALDKYETTKKKITKRFADNPQLKDKLLEKFDANQLKHQQILSTVVEKLRNKTSEANLEKIENIKKENTLLWYNIQKDKIQSRLETAVDNNNIGSKFKQLQNIAVLQELDDTLPEAASEKISAAQIRAEEKLANKLKNSNLEDNEKFEKYIENIKTPVLIKQKFISNLKDSDKLSPAIKARAKNIFNSYSNTLNNKFQNLNKTQQKKFLKQFENKLRSHPANIKFLESINTSDNHNRVKKLLEIQREGIKEKIQKTSNPTKLKSLKQNLQNYPTLEREIQDRQIELKKMPITHPSTHLSQ